MKRIETSPSSRQQGFTLIELSIVLVIIGLIVGGILVGQDLIQAAQLRATITQIERYDATVNTFRSKFNGLPGDLTSCVNFFAAADCPTGTNVTGDNILEDWSGTEVKFSGEIAAFFHQLYTANLIGEPMTDTTNINANGAAVTATAFPAAKMGAGNFLMVYSVSNAVTAYPGMAGINVYRIVGTPSVVAGVPTFGLGMTPLQAFAVDTKKDDGIPNSGIVQATDNTGAANFNLVGDAPTAPGVTKCLSAANTYNTVTANGKQNSPLCEILARASF